MSVIEGYPNTIGNIFSTAWTGTCVEQIAEPVSKYGPREFSPVLGLKSIVSVSVYVVL